MNDNSSAELCRAVQAIELSRLAGRSSLSYPRPLIAIKHSSKIFMCGTSERNCEIELSHRTGSRPTAVSRFRHKSAFMCAKTWNLTFCCRRLETVRFIQLSRELIAGGRRNWILTCAEKDCKNQSLDNQANDIIRHWSTAREQWEEFWLIADWNNSRKNKFELCNVDAREEASLVHRRRWQSAQGWRKSLSARYKSIGDESVHHVNPIIHWIIINTKRRGKVGGIPKYLFDNIST